jgi:hypothetical protein
MRMTLPTGLPSRNAGEKRQFVAPSRAAVANGSSPAATLAERTEPSASIVKTSSTVASPAPLSG